MITKSARIVEDEIGKERCGSEGERFRFWEREGGSPFPNFKTRAGEALRSSKMDQGGMDQAFNSTHAETLM
jgi:hypothetical protein